jgi:Pretoxin HINT domain
MQHPANRSIVLRILVSVALGCITASSLGTTFPSWWIDHRVLNLNVAPDDYAVLNQGQLKNIALAAFKEFELKLPGGAGQDVTLLINGFTEINEVGQRVPKTGTQTDDFAAVSVGQLKAVAKPFYKRFADVFLDGAFSWPIREGSFDDYAVANIGQAKALFGFDFSLPIAIPAPNPVQVTQIDSTTVQFQWTGVPGASSYRIERREPYVYSAANSWQQRAVVAAPANTFTDSVLADQAYAYRAFAIAPAGESQPSQVALTVTGPDGDGDGIPDSVEGDGDSDGDSIPDKLETDSDNDGIPDSIELTTGTNPRDADTDHDSVPDQLDMWPDDPRRSKSIPQATYAAIDLNDYLDTRISPTPFAQPVIDEDGKVAWGGFTDDGSGHSILRSVAWENGNISTHDSDTLYWEFDANGKPGRASGSLTGYVTPYGGGIAADGTINGNCHIGYEQHIDDTVGWYGIGGTTGTFQLSQSSFSISPDFAYPIVTQYYHNENYLTSIDGKVLWMERNRVNVGGEMRPEFKLKVDNRLVFGPPPDGEFYASPAAISPNGSIIWQKGIPFVEETKQYSKPADMGDGYEHTDLDWPFPTGNCRALNDQGWAVGTQLDFRNGELFGYEDPNEPRDPANPNGPKGRGFLGFLWLSDGALLTFHDLLPPEYQEMVRNAIPILITNCDPTTGFPSIAFTAEVANGIKPDQWTSENLIMDWIDPDGPGGDPPKARIKVMSLLDAVGQNRLSTIHSFNSSHLAVGSTNSDEVALFVPVEFVALDAAGNPTEEPNGLRPSMPSPIVDMSCVVSNLAIDSTGQLRGRVTISGTVTSALCDTMPGPEGQIDEMQLYVNDDETATATIQLNVSKTEGTAFSKPYPYVGRAVNYVVNDVPLTEGLNTLRFSAFDKIYENPGYCEWTAEITAEVVPTGMVAGEANVSAATNFGSVVTDPQGRQQLTISYARGTAAPTSITLVETAVGSGILSGTDGAGLTISANVISTAQPTKRRTFTATVNDATRALTETELVLSESGFNTGQFGGTYGYLADANGQAIDPPPPPDGDPGTVRIILERTSMLDESIGGEYHPHVLRMKGPGSWADTFEAKFGNIQSTMLVGPGTAHLFLRRLGTSHPLIFTIKPGNQTPNPFNSNLLLLTLDEIFSMRSVSIAEKFLKGFASGVYAGGYQLVADLGSTIWGGLSYLGNNVAIFGMSTTITVKRAAGANVETDMSYVHFMLEEDRVVHEGISQMANFIWEMGKFFYQMQATQTDLVIALLTGDDLGRMQSLSGLSKMHREIFSMAAEALAELWKSLKGGADKSFNDPQVQGHVLGRAMFEIVSLFFAEFKGATLAKLAKVEFLQKLVAKCPTFSRVSGAIVENINRIARTRMCFVAGTAVWTKDGLKNIECVRTGDFVMSRDEFSGEQSFKPVLETFVTHPVSLVHVRYAALHRHAGEAGGDESSGSDDKPGFKAETVICTRQHPFYVSNREEGRFVEAGQLRIGDQVRLVDGSSANVIQLEKTEATADQRFTTYNFEVADSHTYFVGEGGAWVHNFSFGKSPCDEVFSLYYELRQAGRRHWQDFEEVVRQMGHNRHSAIFGWAADEVMSDMMKLPLDQRVANWPSHTEVRRVMSMATGKAKDVDLGSILLGEMEVPPWVVKERLDLKSVKSFSLESHHGIPKKVQEWLGLTVDPDSCPAYLTTMLEHRGAEVGIHKRLAKKMGDLIGQPPVSLSGSKPPGLTNALIKQALEDTYKEAGLGNFWEVCSHWLNAP